MNNKTIGQYIQFLRKQKKLSQKDLADKLYVSFQAVSKWETGENLPDSSILLNLADILETTTDKILSGGVFIKRNKKINIENLKEGIAALEDMKLFLGEYSMFYIGAVEGINQRLKVNIKEIELFDDKIVIYYNKPNAISPDESRGLCFLTEEKDGYIIEMYI